MVKKKGNILMDNGFVAFLKNKKVQLIFGVIIFFITAYITLALISFLYAGKNDQSIIAEYNTDKLEYTSQKALPNLTDDDKMALKEKKKDLQLIKRKAKNLTGYNGALIGENAINNWLGLGVFCLCVFLFVLSLNLIGVKKISVWKWLIALVFLAIWFALLLASTLDIFFEHTFIKYGGDFGITFRNWLIANIGELGLALVILGTILIFVIIAVSGAIPFFKNLYKKSLDKIKKNNKENLREDEEESVKIGGDIVPKEWVSDDDSTSSSYEKPQEVAPRIEILEKTSSDADSKATEDNIGLIFEEVKAKDDDEISTEEDDADADADADDDERTDAPTNIVSLEPYDPKKDLSKYAIPKYNDKYKDSPLLKEYPQPESNLSEEEKASGRKRIVETLQTFGIGIKKIYETIGPTITLYEIVPEDGVRISKIRNLADDIMLSLAATGIRIIAPIPGKGTIGIEVPNSNPQIVSMFATIASRKFQESKYELPVALGRTITNEVFMFDLAKAPHLLVAGATGQGKSVGLNAIITSLLFKKHPSELKFVLIDPKKVEFNIYADIEKHFLAKLPEEDEPVITDVEKVKQTLNSLCKEMDDRYDLLKAAHTRNIKEYNAKFIARKLNPLKGHKYLPYIVVIVDEFGDLIMTAGKEIEMPIARIAQLARAVGIHMVIATQRPSVNIITGVIKANFPTRVAFKVSSSVDSKTILDGPGAQQLIGRGDLLYSKGNEPTRVQCAFVDTPEVENIVHFISNQQSYPSAFYLPEPDVAEGSGDKKDMDTSKRDSLFDEIARYVVSSQQCSISNIQRQFEIGFNRAGRIVDQMEANNIVGPANGSKPRQVLMSTEYELEKVLNL